MVTQTYPATTTRTTTPVIGGILSIISASMTLLFVLFLSFITPAHSFLAFGGLMIAMLLASILAIAGGILAIKRKEWLLSLIGAIASIFSVVGLLGVIATVLIAISKKEFNNPSPT